MEIFATKLTFHPPRFAAWGNFQDEVDCRPVEVQGAEAPLLKSGASHLVSVCGRNELRTVLVREAQINVRNLTYKTLSRTEHNIPESGNTHPLRSRSDWTLDAVIRAFDQLSPSSSEWDRGYLTALRANFYFENGNLEEARVECDKAIELATLVNDNDTLGASLAIKGTVLFMTGNDQADEQYFFDSIALLDSSCNPKLQAISQMHYGNYLMMRGLHSEALPHFEEAKRKFEVCGAPEQLAPMIVIGCVYFDSGDFRRALETWMSIIDTAQAGKQKDRLGTLLVNIANALTALGDIESARRYAAELFEVASSIGTVKRLSNYYITMGEIEFASGNYQKALSEFEQARTILLQANNRSTVAQVKISIGRCLVFLGKIDKGIEELQTAMKDLLVLDHKSLLVLAYRNISEAYGRKEQYRESLEYFQKQAEIENEIFSLNFKNQLFALERKIASERAHAETKELQLQAKHLEEKLSLQAAVLATQTELLVNFRDDLRQIVRQAYDPASALKKINEKLKALSGPDVNWTKFEQEFVSVHPKFRRKLKEQFPSLTNQELRLCQILRSGLKSHEAARLMCITERGVEQHRLRVRRKLGLHGKESLTEFLKNLD